MRAYESTSPSIGEQGILVVDDEPASVELLRITLGLEYKVYTATDGASALALLGKHPEIALAIVDQRMPEMTGTEFIQRTIERYPDLVRIILTGFTDVQSLIDAINAGRVYRYLTKPWNRDELLATVRQGLEAHRLATDNLRLQEELREANARLRLENVQLKREVKGRYHFEEIIGTSLALQKALQLVERLVATDTTVLITGETGTGKELIARALHYNGPRAEKTLLSANCAGFPAADMLSSELFGHKRGAFTGAVEERQGLFKAADGGTVFLDEIGECSESVQGRLLRVLDQREITRLGEDRPIKVNVRVVAATNRDLAEDVKVGRFREDLFYRLNVVQIPLPPLRERTDDIPVLAQHFLDRFNRSSGKNVPGFAAETLALLSAHPFKGNVRELLNIVERAHALVDADSYVTPDLLPKEVSGSVSEAAPAGARLRGAVDRFEAQLIREALEQTGGNQTRAAVDLGISRRALIDKLQKYGIGDAK
jgi:two-component system response regulator HupR/HoxA